MPYIRTALNIIDASPKHTVTTPRKGHRLTDRPIELCNVLFHFRRHRFIGVGLFSDILELLFHKRKEFL